MEQRGVVPLPVVRHVHSADTTASVVRLPMYNVPEPPHADRQLWTLLQVIRNACVHHHGAWIGVCGG